MLAAMATPQETVKLDEHGEEIIFEAILYKERIKWIYCWIALFCCCIWILFIPILTCYFFYSVYANTWRLYLTPRGIRFIQPNFFLPCLFLNDRNFIPMEDIVGRVRVKSGTASTVEVRMTLPQKTIWCWCWCLRRNRTCHFCYCENTIWYDVCDLYPVYNIDEFVAAVNKELDKRDQLQGGAITTAM